MTTGVVVGREALRRTSVEGLSQTLQLRRLGRIGSVLSIVAQSTAFPLALLKPGSWEGTLLVSITTSESHHALPKYRADIDGLRAIAVLLVVFNHLQFRHFEGGYVGVDVFFVISGYLIGTSLIAEFGRGSFSLTSFYERRIRRIFPALLAMLLIVSVLAYRFMMPDALVGYAGSMVAAALSFSNFYFWHQSGYFAAPSEAKPLLHTWSLAVEEQFYIFFPLLLFFVFRWSQRRLRIVLWAVTAITFALAVWVTGQDASAAFFWSPLRAWELLAGVLISQHSFAWFRFRAAREIATFAGLLLIVVPGFRYTAQTLFPGWTALLPCLGTALIIAAGGRGKSGVASLLSTSPFRFVGLISYSLYLWHWPILVFQKTGLLLSDRAAWERTTKLEILAVSLLAAIVSWRFVETPFRKGRLKLQRTPLFLLSGGVVVCLLCLCGGIIYAKGVPSRFSNEEVRVASFEQYDTAKAWRTGSCFLLPENTFRDFKPELCLNSLPGHKEYLLYGDSTAAQLYPGLSKVFPELHFQQATSSSCPPKEDQTEVASPYRNNCRDLWNYIHHDYLPAHHPDAVILAGGWSTSYPASLQAEIQSFQSEGIVVVLVGPVLDFDMPLPLLLSTEMQRSGDRQMHEDRLTGHQSQANLASDREMARTAHDRWKVRYISYYRTLCDHQAEISTKSQWETTTGCPLFTDQAEPLMFDNHHLTISGSIMVATATRRLGLLP